MVVDRENILSVVFLQLPGSRGVWTECAIATRASADNGGVFLVADSYPEEKPGVLDPR